MACDVCLFQCTQKYLCELYREGSYHPKLYKPSKTEKEVSNKIMYILLEDVLKVVASKSSIKGKYATHLYKPEIKFTSFY